MEKSNHELKIEASFIQIYNEKIFDLLTECNYDMEEGITDAHYKIRYADNEFYIDKLPSRECTTCKDLLEVFHTGVKNRFVASNKLNNASSRSHSIFILSLKRTNCSDKKFPKLFLVDLAGSERMKYVDANTKQAKENIDINKSLYTLRQVIVALSSKHNKNIHVPYRESKLTSILRQSLGGNSYCLMISCISSCDAYIDETISTLMYASKASAIVNKLTKNEDPLTTINNEYKKQIIELTNQLQQAYSQIGNIGEILKQKGIKLDYEAPRVTINNNFNSNVITLITPKKEEKMKEEQNVWERLRENVNTVREVLQSNIKIQRTVNEQSNEIENLKFENDTLMAENTELRNKLEISNTMQNGTNDSNDGKDRNIVAEKIYNLQRENATLKARVLILEKQHIEYQHQTKNIDFEGKDQIEPVRPVTTHKFCDKFNLSTRKPLLNRPTPEEQMRQTKRQVDSRTCTAMENFKRGISARKKSELPKKLSEIPPRHDSSDMKAYNKNSLISLNKIPSKYTYYDHNNTISDQIPTINKVSIKGQDYYELQSFTYYDNFNPKK